ncbi:conserved hypothetical protein; putative secreted/membrane protein [Bradyrhizobium sp. ORS 278]|uniref:DUF58 domain-containing protein n=1 Tax=Bradyrhizobium sp. (strain ORS 278) TaxID=114615 RepID=UPI0001508D8B|nr:DUF58 domain-containing protein [Bradyrhizobium sp. ORS 278]CAL78011.1 conserved hypothetical protein; putative secreted/membrane protein [Bradyrhizobium sp. ORS 278]
MIRPTLRAVLLFAATVPATLVVLVLRPELWAVAIDLGLFVVALIGIDALLCVRFRNLDIACDAPARLFVGTEAELWLTITLDTAARAVTFEALLEQRGELAPPALRRLTGAPQQPASASLPIVPKRRGQIFFDALWLRWRGPLALAERMRRIPLDRTIDVLPDVRGISSAAVQFFSRDAIEGVKVQQQRGEGTEFESLRDHAAGLDNRFIDWKRSAKHLKLLSKEFSVERNHQIVLAFDTGHLMAEPIDGLPRLDHAIHAGLLLGWISLRNGDYVGSFGFDAQVRQFLQPSRGMSYFLKLQAGSSQLAYQTEETNFTLGLAELNLRLKRRALVVMFTEFIDTTTAELLLESVHRMANRHAVIFVTLRDPMLPNLVEAPPRQFRDAAEAVVAHDLLRDRAVVLERLARMGVHCLEVPPRGLAVGLVNRYLTIKKRGLL